MLGAAHLLPAWMLAGHDGILAVDVGGTNIRAGVVKLNQGKAKDLSQAVVLKSELWRHGDEDVKRDDAVDRLVEMLEAHVKDAKKSGFKLAPLIGIGCPGDHRHGRLDRARRAEPARQLGEQPVQPAALHPRQDPRASASTRPSW